MLSVTSADPDHSQFEQRWLTFGVSAQGNFLMVSHTDEGETYRNVSAGQGIKSERKIYEQIGF